MRDSTHPRSSALIPVINHPPFSSTKRTQQNNRMEGFGQHKALRKKVKQRASNKFFDQSVTHSIEKTERGPAKVQSKKNNKDKIEKTDPSSPNRSETESTLLADDTNQNPVTTRNHCHPNPAATTNGQVT